MSVFTAFAIGTGHSRAEPNTLMVRLYNGCGGTDAVHLGSPVDQMKYIIDGIGKRYDPETGEVSTNLLAQATGWGLADKTDEVVAHIRRLRPEVVNLTGHSRGAIICTRIAAKLARQMPSTRCNLFLVDPVERTLIGTAEYNATTHRNVSLFRQLIMENEGSWLFGPRAMTHTAAATNTIHMPGRHGTATQTGQPVGMVTHMLAVNFLALCGSDMRERPFTTSQLCDTYSRIGLANPVKKHGSKLGRLFQDLDAGKRVFGWSGVRKLGKAFGAANAWRDDAYFINNDHARHFQSTWPDVFLALTGKLRPTLKQEARLVEQVRSIRARAPRAYRTLPTAFRDLA